MRFILLQGIVRIFLKSPLSIQYIDHAFLILDWKEVMEVCEFFFKEEKTI